MTAEGETTAPEDRLSLRRLALRRRAFASSLVVAAATTVITGCAHAVGGGVAPDALLLLAAFVATLLVLAPVLGARGSAPRRVVAVTIAQLLQHGVYSLPRPSAGHAGHASGHHDAALHDAVLGPILVEHAHAAMPLAHVAAGVITLWLLRAVPRAVAAVLEAVSLRLAAAALAWTPPRVRRAASVSAVSPAHRAALDVLRSALVRRGPPVLAV
ncbi:hypothetical protein ACVWW9_000335 [Agrococcus sp. UYP33]